MIEIQIQKGTEAHDRQGRNGQRAILLSQNVRDAIFQYPIDSIDLLLDSSIAHQRTGSFKTK